MKHTPLSFVVGIATMVLITCWPDASQVVAQPHAPAAGAANGDASGGAVAGHGTTAGISGKVVETKDAGQYTYVLVDDGSKKVWAAAPHFTVAVGDKVIVPEGMPMRDFESKTLNRTFDLVYFVSSVQVVGAKAAQAPAAEEATSPHGMPGHPTGNAAKVDLSNIKKAEGGQTVGELFANKGSLAGKDVVVRGRVVKYVPSVMGKNWIHVQDGTGAAGTNDLTVSTSASAAVGNTVLVRGKLGTDKDLGFGYKYDILIEDAAVSVE